MARQHGASSDLQRGSERKRKGAIEREGAHGNFEDGDVACRPGLHVHVLHACAACFGPRSPNLSDAEISTWGALALQGYCSSWAHTRIYISPQEAEQPSVALSRNSHRCLPGVPTSPGTNLAMMLGSPASHASSPRRHGTPWFAPPQN